MKADSGGPRRSVSLGRTLVLLFLSGALACQHYRTVSADALTPSSAVRVRYDSPRPVVIRSTSDSAARPQLSELTGRVVRRVDDSVEVRVDRTVPASGQAVLLAPGTVVAVPLDTTAIQARRFSPGRTAAAVLGALGAGALALFIACGEYCR